nr:MAG TPA: hypothetical protein [Caudoviricetes sp.]
MQSISHLFTKHFIISIMIPEQKTVFRFAGMVSLQIPSLFFIQYKIPPPYRKYDDGNRNDIGYHSGKL